MFGGRLAALLLEDGERLVDVVGGGAERAGHEVGDGPNLGAGFVLAVDGEVVARGAGTVVPAVDPALAQVQRLTEMAVCAEMRRISDEYEQNHAEERAILRTLRQRWMARVIDDQVRGEDALRYVVEAARSMVKKEEPPASGGGT